MPPPAIASKADAVGDDQAAGLDRVANDRVRQWMLGATLGGRDERKDLVLGRGARHPHHVRHSRLAFRQRACLVEHDRPHRAQPLEGLGIAEQDAGFRAFAGPDHDRRRRGEPEGAGAGNDQHRDGVEQGKVERRRGADREPDDERQCREAEHGRHEVTGHDVGEALDRCP